MSEKDDLLKRLSDDVYDMEEDDVTDAAQLFVERGYPALDGIMDGLVDGMTRASEAYEEEEYFVTDLLLCSDAMYAGLDVLRPHLPEGQSDGKIVGVIGVVEGDTHDIGKNLVRIMLETSGFSMIDLGRDVPPQRFVDAARENGARLVCLSTLMTTTMPVMGKVVELLNEQGMRADVKVMVGGGPVSQRFCDKIGADGYSANAVAAVRLAKRLMEAA